MGLVFIGGFKIYKQELKRGNRKAGVTQEVSNLGHSGLSGRDFMDKVSCFFIELYSCNVLI